MTKRKQKQHGKKKKQKKTKTTWKKYIVINQEYFTKHDQKETLDEFSLK